MMIKRHFKRFLSVVEMDRTSIRNHNERDRLTRKLTSFKSSKSYQTFLVLDLFQCDQIGRFLKVFVTNFLTRVAKMSGNLLGYIERDQFISGTAVDTFGLLSVKMGYFQFPHLVAFIVISYVCSIHFNNA